MLFWSSGTQVAGTVLRVGDIIAASRLPVSYYTEHYRFQDCPRQRVFSTSGWMGERGKSYCYWAAGNVRRKEGREGGKKKKRKCKRKGGGVQAAMKGRDGRVEDWVVQ